MGSDTQAAGTFALSCIFQSTPPRMGSDTPIRAKMTTSHIFQSTLPHGERQTPSGCGFPFLIFQSTLPHGERQIAILGIPLLITISIHAPAWGATLKTIQKLLLILFQSTLPHGERHGVAYHDDSQIVFQSTLPAWGATFVFACSECFFNISIHTPRMGSDHPYLHVDQVQHISIHAPRMGSDVVL